MALLENPGILVTRDELRERLWSKDTFVDFEHGLNAAVTRLRQALGDSAEQPRYIETLAKRGYRFCGSVEQAVETGKSAGMTKKTHSAARWIAGGLLLSAGCAVTFFVVSSQIGPSRTTVQPRRPVPLTSFRGTEANPGVVARRCSSGIHLERREGEQLRYLCDADRILRSSFATDNRSSPGCKPCLVPGRSHHSVLAPAGWRCVRTTVGSGSRRPGA